MLDATVTDAIQPAATLADAQHHQCYSIRPQRWACVYTEPQAERWADSNLRRRGYLTYLPLFTKRVRDNAIRSLRHTVIRPLFPRYLFIRFNHLSESWTPIRDTPGVHDLVRCGSEPAYASEAAVSALQADEPLRAVYHQTGGALAPGTPVAVSGGAFQNVPAVVLSIGKEMALVSIMMLGQLREVAVDLSCLKERDD